MSPSNREKPAVAIANEATTRPGETSPGEAGAISDAEVPVVRFLRLASDGLAPMRADRAALGALPTSAFQYCEPVCSASAFGYYVFPPLEFSLQYDGTEFLWTHDDGVTWYPLSEAHHLPGLPESFDAQAPVNVRGLAPPFLSPIPVPGLIQIWSGWLVRTRPGWSSLVRPAANVARSQHFEIYEGIIDTDRRVESVFANLRVITVNRPIKFVRTHPLLQLQPLHRSTYDERALRTFLVEGAEDLTHEDWELYRAAHEGRALDPMLRPGRYSAEARRRSRTDGA
jgi:hypothetical protein